jgi:hypothetical protein
MISKAVKLSGTLALLSLLFFTPDSTAMMRRKRAASDSQDSTAKSASSPFMRAISKLSLTKKPTPPQTPPPNRKMSRRSLTAPASINAGIPAQATEEKEAAEHIMQENILNNQLWDATQEENLNRIQALLKQGANPHYNTGNSSPLFVACVRESVPLIKIFALHTKLDITESVDSRWSPLLKAVDLNKPDFLGLLLHSHHEKDEHFNKELEDALKSAVQKEKLAAIPVLLNHTPDRNSSALKAFVYAHAFKKPAIYDYIADSVGLDELLAWFTIFSRHNPRNKALYAQAKQYLHATIREQYATKALAHAELAGFERESQENMRNHAQHDNMLAFGAELRRHAHATACSSAERREKRENARNHAEHDKTLLRAQAYEYPQESAYSPIGTPPDASAQALAHMSPLSFSNLLCEQPLIETPRPSSEKPANQSQAEQKEHAESAAEQEEEEEDGWELVAADGNL